MQATELRAALIEAFGKQVRLDIGAQRRALLSIVSPAFAGLDYAKRRAAVLAVLQRAGYAAGMLDLYSPDEAEQLELDIEEPEQEAAASIPTLADAARAVRDGRTLLEPQQEELRRSGPRVFVFYSFKGGVGRTTALLHTAALAAQAGERPVLVDLDIEAPGLDGVAPPERPIDCGLLDALWERCTRAPRFAAERDYPVSRFAYPVAVPGSAEALLIVPAGRVDEDYIARLGVLEGSSGEQLSAAWTGILNELQAEFSPTQIYIDARTGLNRWGGLSLLGNVEEVFLVAYPSPQNANGLLPVLRLLEQAMGRSPHIVFSPVPEGRGGKELVLETCSALGLPEPDGRGEDIDAGTDRLPPLVVHEVAGLRTAERLPLGSALPQYEPLAARLREQAIGLRASEVLSTPARWEVVESLTFPAATPDETFDYASYFLPTDDFVRAVSEGNWLVAGRMGTGKSILYRLLCSELDLARSHAQSKLDDVRPLSGHGAANSLRPNGKPVFESIDAEARAARVDWYDLWAAYAVVALFRDGELDTTFDLHSAELPSLQRLVTGAFARLRGSHPAWLSRHNKALVELAKHGDECRDALLLLDGDLRVQRRRVWLLYDDLDQDLGDSEPWARDALVSLFRLLYDLHNRPLRQFQLRVFLRLDLWERLDFNNKSHFGSTRVVTLEWNRDSFLRLAWRFACGGSEPFRRLALDRLGQPGFDEQAATEERLRAALSPLWGTHRDRSTKGYTARWVFSRMGDTKGNAFPRALAALLTEAKSRELQCRESSEKPPNDRLLRANSLTEAFKSASEQRVRELRNEYPSLGDFFQHARALRSQFARHELDELCSGPLAGSFTSSAALLEQLTTAGVIEAAKSTSQYDFRFADLYIEGLGVTRVQGQRT